MFVPITFKLRLQYTIIGAHKLPMKTVISLVWNHGFYQMTLYTILFLNVCIKLVSKALEACQSSFFFNFYNKNIQANQLSGTD